MNDGSEEMAVQII